VTAPLRRAGSGRAPDGALVTWSVAEGGRGRRWRWVVTAAGGDVRHAGLIELDTTGRFARLELASGAEPIHEHAFPDSVCLVLGSERRGLSPSGLSVCDNAVFVAQPGKVASLNVSVAASLALYEFRRQHWASD